MVRLNGAQMRQKLQKSVRAYCQGNKRQEKKEKVRVNGKVS